MNVIIKDVEECHELKLDKNNYGTSPNHPNWKCLNTAYYGEDYSVEECRCCGYKFYTSIDEHHHSNIFFTFTKTYLENYENYISGREINNLAYLLIEDNNNYQSSGKYSSYLKNLHIIDYNTKLYLQQDEIQIHGWPEFWHEDAFNIICKWCLMKEMCATIIQEAWKLCRYNPDYTMCEKVLESNMKQIGAL